MTSKGNFERKDHLIKRIHFGIFGSLKLQYKPHRIKDS